MSDETSATAIRQQAARRRAKLLQRGNERIEQLQSGHDSVSYSSKNKDEQNRATNMMSTFNTHVRNDANGSNSLRQTPCLPTSSSEQDVFQLSPELLFTMLGFPFPIDDNAAAAPSSTFSSQLTESSRAPNTLRIKRAKAIEAVRMPLVFIFGFIAVLFSTLLGKIVNHMEREEFHTSPNYLFFQINSISTTTFCCLEIAIQIFIIRTWGEIINPISLLNLGFFFPLVQIICLVVPRKTFLLLIISPVVTYVALHSKRIFGTGFHMRRLMEIFLNYLSEIIHSVSSAKSYMSDYAIYCVANATMVFLISLVGRCVGV